MEKTLAAPRSATVHVDPSCPFAWITSHWLDEVAQHSDVTVQRDLMSLGALNEGRDLDPVYRTWTDQAWRPARVAAAILKHQGQGEWLDFYERFGTRKHVDGLEDDAENIATTLRELDLPAELADAAEDTHWDDDLRQRTEGALAPLGTDGGTPLIHIGDTAFFGPVLTGIPRGDAAVRLWDAFAVLATTPEFTDIKRGRPDELITS